MSLALERGTEADALRFSEIENSSYGATSTLFPLLYPNGATPRVSEYVRKGHEMGLSDPNVIYWKAVDPAAANPHEAIAYAIYRVYREDQPPSELGGPKRTPALSDDLGGDRRPEVWEALMDTNDVMQKKLIKGQRRLYLRNLCTHSEHMRRGAGTLLLVKGAEIAEQEGLDIWLSASPYGKLLYEKVGFHTIEGGKAELDLTPFGGEGMLLHIAMKRPLHEKVVMK